LVLVSLCWFVHCCVWGNFEVVAIHLAFRNKSIIVFHATTTDHRARRKEPSYFDLEWWWSSLELLPPCLWWHKLRRWCYCFLFISWPFGLFLPSCNLVDDWKVESYGGDACNISPLHLIVVKVCGVTKISLPFQCWWCLFPFLS